MFVRLTMFDIEEPTDSLPVLVRFDKIIEVFPKKIIAKNEKSFIDYTVIVYETGRAISVKESMQDIMTAALKMKEASIAKSH